MALAIVNKTAGMVYKTGGTNSVKTWASGSLTPTASSLWAVAMGWTAQRGDPAAPTFGISGTNGLNVTWAERVTLLRTAGEGQYWERISWFTGAPSSGTAGVLTAAITDNGVSTDNGGVIDAFEVTGQHASPIGTTGTAGFSSGATSLGITLAAPPASDSIILGFAYDDGNASAAIVPPSSPAFTEANDLGAAWGSEWETAYIVGGGAQSLTWTGLQSGNLHGIVALEILAAAGAATKAPPPATNRIRTPLFQRRTT